MYLHASTLAARCLMRARLDLAPSAHEQRLFVRSPSFAMRMYAPRSISTAIDDGSSESLTSVIYLSRDANSETKYDNVNCAVKIRSHVSDHTADFRAVGVFCNAWRRHLAALIRVRPGERTEWRALHKSAPVSRAWRLDALE